MRNNLKSFAYDLSRVPEELLRMRAQQLSLEDFDEIWTAVSVGGK
jgi:hypothetical protein